MVRQRSFWHGWLRFWGYIAWPSHMRRASADTFQASSHSQPLYPQHSILLENTRKTAQRQTADMMHCTHAGRRISRFSNFSRGIPYVCIAAQVSGVLCVLYSPQSMAVAN